jgi:hypothetical protein
MKSLEFNRTDMFPVVPLSKLLKAIDCDLNLKISEEDFIHLFWGNEFSHDCYKRLCFTQYLYESNDKIFLICKYLKDICMPFYDSILVYIS